MLNRQWLSTFITLVEVGHFTRTAEHLHMTQPGVSQHIQKLEAQAGVSLLYREGRQFELTAAGETLYHWARTLQQEERQLLASLSEDAPDEGECRIACSGALALQLYPLFLDHQATFPNLRLSLEAAPNQRILAQLAAGEVELGLVSHAEIPSTFSYQKLGEQPLQLVVPAAWQGDETSFGVLDELGCPIRWLDADPAQLSPGEDVSERGFPMLAAGSWAHLARFLPWGEALLQP